MEIIYPFFVLCVLAAGAAYVSDANADLKCFEVNKGDVRIIVETVGGL